MHFSGLTPPFKNLNNFNLKISKTSLEALIQHKNDNVKQKMKLILISLKFPHSSMKTFRCICALGLRLRRVHIPCRKVKSLFKQQLAAIFIDQIVKNDFLSISTTKMLIQLSLDVLIFFIIIFGSYWMSVHFCWK